jgi:preprotein translocase subunit SecF
MKRFLVAVLLVLIAVGGMGYYLGWFNFGSDHTSGTDKITFTVDENKIKEDEQKAKDKVHDLGQKAKNAVAPPPAKD